MGRHPLYNAPDGTLEENGFELVNREGWMGCRWYVLFFDCYHVAKAPLDLLIQAGVIETPVVTNEQREKMDWRTIPYPNARWLIDKPHGILSRRSADVLPVYLRHGMVM